MPVSPADLTRNQLLQLVDQVYPGNFNSFSKAELLDYIKRNPESRFQKLLTSSNVIALIEKNRREAQRAKTRANQLSEPIRRLAGKPKLDPQYDIEIEFSKDGEAFSNPIDVESNTTYQCRMRLRQHQGEWNAIGFTLDWKLSGSLSLADGHGTRTHEETISNPLVISRLVRTGTVTANTTMWVKVVVVERYR